MSTTKTLLALPTRTLSRLRALARRRKTTVSELMREAVEKTYGFPVESPRERDWKNHPMVKFFESQQKKTAKRDGPADLAENHDFYLYGWKKKRGENG